MGRAARSMSGAALLLTVLAAAPSLAAAHSSGKPLQVQRSSLTQGGRVMYWRLRLTRRFDLGVLKSEGRSLCLLIERPAHGHVAGQLCAIPPTGRRRGPSLTYAKVTDGRPGVAHVIAGKLRRPKTHELLATFLPHEVGLSYRRFRWQVRNTIGGSACTAQAPRRPSCTSVYPARPRLLRLRVPRLVGCVPGGNSLVFGGPSRRKEIALTFDDGPWGSPPTSQFLDVLERNHVVATFFEIGSQIGTYDRGGALERRMLADGDMIGDHTWTHPDMTTLSSSAQRSQLSMTANAITQATHGFHTCIWRPPYGAYNSGVVSLARSMGLVTIQWDVDTVDWSMPGTSTIYQRAVSGAHNGAIILQHFGGGPRYETLAAVPQEIATLRRRGYRFVTVTQLLGLRLIYK